MLLLHASTLAAAQVRQQCGPTVSHGLRWAQRCLGVLLKAHVGYPMWRGEAKSEVVVVIRGEIWTRL